MSGYTIKGGLPHVRMAAGETLDWSRDWTTQLELEETVTSSIWEVTSGLVAGIAALSGTVATQWLTTVDEGSFAVTNQITTSVGRVIRRTFIVDVVAQR